MDEDARALQRRLLTQLKLEYPSDVRTEELGYAQDDPLAVGALVYLEEHKLVELVKHKPLSEPLVVITARITARGLDYLEDDGGLTAALGVVTVRFSGEAIQALLRRHVDEAALPPDEKSRLRKLIDKATEKGVSKLLDALIDQGMKSGPTVIQAIQTALS